MQIYHLKRDKGEEDVKKYNPESSVWDDGEEPVSAIDFQFILDSKAFVLLQTKVIVDTYVTENCKTNIKEPIEVGSLGVDGGSETSASMLGSMGRKSMLGGLLGKSLKKGASIVKRDKITKKGSVMLDRTASPADGGEKPKPASSFKMMMFMNRSNTALGDMFNKKYLEPEVYGKTKDSFMGKSPDKIPGDSDESCDISQERAGSISPLKRHKSQEEFDNEEDRIAYENI